MLQWNFPHERRQKNTDDKKFQYHSQYFDLVICEIPVYAYKTGVLKVMSAKSPNTVILRFSYCHFQTDGKLQNTLDALEQINAEKVLLSLSDGIMDEVYSWRQTYAADAVMLLLADSSSGGLAWCCADGVSAYAVMFWNNGANTFAHEFGHNQGGAHNPDDVDCTGCDAYSRGHVFFGDDDVEYGTVMSYPGERIQYFSNPNVDFQGVPTGIADARDNARTVRNSRYTVENFRLTRFDIWVDFAASGPQYGTPANPYASLTPAVDQVPTAQFYSELPNLWIEAGDTSETLTIDKPMILNACGGIVRIGG